MSRCLPFPKPSVGSLSINPILFIQHLSKQITAIQSAFIRWIREINPEDTEDHIACQVMTLYNSFFECVKIRHNTSSPISEGHWRASGKNIFAFISLTRQICTQME